MDGFGSRLKKCRTEKGFTQVELGKRVGMSAQRISNIERSYTTGLGAADIARLAAILETSSDYLISGSLIDEAKTTVAEHQEAYDLAIMVEKIKSLSPENREKAEEYIDMLKTLGEVKSGENFIDLGKKA